MTNPDSAEPHKLHGVKHLCRFYVQFAIGEIPELTKKIRKWLKYNAGSMAKMVAYAEWMHVSNIYDKVETHLCTAIRRTHILLSIKSVYMLFS